MMNNRKITGHLLTPPLGISFMILAAGILMIPYLTATYWSDDLPNHYIFAAVDRFHLSFFQRVWETIFLWMHYNGRVILSYLSGMALLYCIKNVLLYHLSLVTLLTINIFLFLKILKKLGVDKKTTILFFLILLSLFRITTYHDPIASLSGLYPLLGIMLSLSLFFLLKWTEVYTLQYMIASVVIAFCSLFFYEINIIYYFLALPALFYHRKKVTSKQFHQALFLQFFSLAGYLSLVFYMRLQHPPGYPGVQFGASLSLFFITYLKQVYAALPGSYYFTQGILSYNLSSVLHDFRSSIYAITLFITVFTTLLIFLSPHSNKEDGFSKNTYILALIVLLVLPVTVAISSKYQNEVEMVWGIGYLPIYYQYFALGILLTGGIKKLSRNTYARLLIILVISTYTTLNWMENMHVTHLLNEELYEPSVILSQQINKGLMKNVQNGDVITLTNGTRGMNNLFLGNLIYSVTGKRIVVTGEPGVPSNYKQRENAVNYFLQINKEDNQKIYYTLEEKAP